jgi:hypothetical protein
METGRPRKRVPGTNRTGHEKNSTDQSYLVSHGCTDISDSVKQMTRRLAKEYKIDIRPAGIECKKYQL